MIFLVFNHKSQGFEVLYTIPLSILIVCVLTVGSRHENPLLLRGNYHFSPKIVKKLSCDLCLEMPNFSMGWGVSLFLQIDHSHARGRLKNTCKLFSCAEIGGVQKSLNPQERSKFV